MALVRADFGKLEDLRQRAAQVASVGFRETLARRLAATTMTLLANEFNRSVNPYGVAWKPVFRNRIRDRRARMGPRGRRGDKPLIDTGRLRAAATALPQVSGSMVRVSIPVEYASYHQEGTSRIARRQIVPDDAGGLGEIWSEAFRKETERAVIDAMKDVG